MQRTTIVLPEALLTRLRRAAAERGVSMATLIREAVEEKVGRERPVPRSLGIGASSVRGIARRTGEVRARPREWR